MFITEWRFLMYVSNEKQRYKQISFTNYGPMSIFILLFNDKYSVVFVFRSDVINELTRIILLFL
jgi:hypothetical protein